MPDKNGKKEESTLKVSGEDYTRIIEAKKAFGWRLEGNQRKKARKSRTYKLRFSRPTTLPYKERLIELEKMYFDKESSRKFFYQTDILNYILLYLLGILPGLIYTIVKAKSKKKVKKYNNEISRIQQGYTNEARNILHTGSNPNARAVPSTSANTPISKRNTTQTMRRPNVQPMRQGQPQANVTHNHPTPVKNPPVKPGTSSSDDFS